MINFVTLYGATWCGGGATSVTRVNGIGKPTWEFGATRATYIKKYWETVKR